MLSMLGSSLEDTLLLFPSNALLHSVWMDHPRGAAVEEHLQVLCHRSGIIVVLHQNYMVVLVWRLMYDVINTYPIR